MASGSVPVVGTAPRPPLGRNRSTVRNQKHTVLEKHGATHRRYLGSLNHSNRAKIAHSGIRFSKVIEICASNF